MAFLQLFIDQRQPMEMDEMEQGTRRQSIDEHEKKHMSHNITHE